MMQTLRARAASVPAWLAWPVSMLFLAAWLLGTSTGTLREQLKDLQFWWLEATAFLALLFAGYVFKHLRAEFDRQDAIRMGVLAAVAMGLTLFVAPRTNRIFYDEQIYQSVGRNLGDLRRAQVCNDGIVEYGRLQCASGEYNKQPYAYPHVLSLAYRLFGVREGIAFAVNALVMGATVCAVYLLAGLLFRDRDAALFSGLLLALTPEQLIWSATAAVEPSASLALVVALVCAALYARIGGGAALAAAAVATAYAVQFRPESGLILAVGLLLIRARLRDERTRARVMWIALLFCWLCAVHVAHLFAVRHVGWGTEGARFALQYVPDNLRVNGWFYIYDGRFPPAFTVLAILGAAVRGFGSERMAMGLYFLLFLGIGLLFYAGSYDYGADVRYSLMTYPPIAVLGGRGAAWLAGRLRDLYGLLPVRALLGSALAFQFLWYAPLVRATTEEGWAARADVRFARAVARELPPDSYVLTHNPGMFHLWGVNAGQMSHVTRSPAYVAHLTSRYTGGVYVHWNFWCNVQDPVQPEFCRKALAMRPADLVREHRERDQRFAFYRMKEPQP
jgi:4-amino-4-deoxy-L-arabinose transferase-like glycosyltransferase